MKLGSSLAVLAVASHLAHAAPIPAYAELHVQQHLKVSQTPIPRSTSAPPRRSIEPAAALPSTRSTLAPRGILSLLALPWSTSWSLFKTVCKAGTNCALDALVKTANKKVRLGGPGAKTQWRVSDRVGYDGMRG